MANMVYEAKRAVEAFCASRVPADLQDEIRIECARRGKAVTIVGSPWPTADHLQLPRPADGPATDGEANPV
jgi:hypothetical protein